MTKVLGSHTIKAGADIRQINYLQQNTGDILRYQGDTTWTQSSNTLINRDGSVEGDTVRYVPVGHCERCIQLPAVPLVETVPYAASTSHDDWKVTRRLT